jgi:hypothetical protein
LQVEGGQAADRRNRSGARGILTELGDIELSGRRIGNSPAARLSSLSRMSHGGFDGMMPDALAAFPLSSSARRAGAV